jgi:hypothetical protein
MWMAVPESQGFLGYQAQEDQKDPWGSLDREAPQDQVWVLLCLLFASDTAEMKI